MGQRFVISVIIPVHNGALYIEDALESVFNQTDHDYEIIVINDSSTDNTGDLLKNTKKIFAFIQEVMAPPEHSNIGIRESRGEFIAFLDADDMWLPRKLEMQRQIIHILGNKVGFLFSDFSLYRDGKIINQSHIKNYFQIFNKLHLDFDDIFPCKMKFSEAGMKLTEEGGDSWILLWKYLR